MRSCTTMMLMILLCLGCDPAEEDRRNAAENESKQLKLASENEHASHQLPHSATPLRPTTTPRVHSRADHQTASLRQAQRSALSRNLAVTCW